MPTHPSPTTPGLLSCASVFLITISFRFLAEKGLPSQESLDSGSRYVSFRIKSILAEIQLDRLTPVRHYAQ
jgi:hypothetical protein